MPALGVVEDEFVRGDRLASKSSVPDEQNSRQLIRKNQGCKDDREFEDPAPATRPRDL